MAGWILLVIALLLFIFSLFFAFSSSLRVSWEKHFHKRKTYKVLKYFCDENDQLLLNKVYLVLEGDEERPTYFDHIVFADKYVYLIDDFFAEGGIYGNTCDKTLFVRDYHDKSNRIPNPILLGEEKRERMEKTLGVDPKDHMFVSVVVYNDSLLVPPGIGKKEQSSWFLPVKELEKTLKEAEQDDVSPLSHQQTEALLTMLKEKSDKVKKTLIDNKKKKKQKKAVKQEDTAE